MALSETIGLFGGAVLLGAVHGVEPGHGWPVAASYALDKGNKWLHGFAASFLLGFGHLVSSIAMVAVFFYAKNYFNLTQINKPYVLIENFNVAGIETLTVGGPVSLVAGVLLIGLGIREYYGGGHSHDHGGDGHGHDEYAHDNHDHHDHDHAHDHHDHDHDHSHSHDKHEHGHDDHAHQDGGILARIKGAIPFLGGGHSHDHGGLDEAADRGLLGIAWFAFILGFAHEEEFEIIALCAGSNYCLELMSVYAITVILGIVGLTLMLVAGYHSYEEKVKQYTPYLPAFSAAVLILMGMGFITGLF